MAEAKLVIVLYPPVYYHLPRIKYLRYRYKQTPHSTIMNMKVSMKFSLFSLKRMVGKYFFRINKKILVWGVILGRIMPATI